MRIIVCSLMGLLFSSLSSCIYYSALNSDKLRKALYSSHQTPPKLVVDSCLVLIAKKLRSGNSSEEIKQNKTELSNALQIDDIWYLSFWWSGPSGALGFVYQCRYKGDKCVVLGEKIVLSE